MTAPMPTRSIPRRRLDARPVTRLAAVVAISLLGLLSFAGPASAHTELTGSDPADGATLLTAPASVALTFNEQVQNFAATVVVTGPDGQTYTADDATLGGMTVTAPLAPLGSAGIYTVAYRIVSADDHPVTGQTTFAYAPAPPTTGAGRTPTAPPVRSTEPSAPTDLSPTPTTSSGAAGAVTNVGTTSTAATTDTGPAGWVWVTAAPGGALLIAGLAWTITRNRRRGAG